MRVVVFGLWHLGCVTAACLAAAGHRVVGLDPDEDDVSKLRRGLPPLHEPGLAELRRSGESASLLHVVGPGGAGGCRGVVGDVRYAGERPG